MNLEDRDRDLIARATTLINAGSRASDVKAALIELGSSLMSEDRDHDGGEIYSAAFGHAEYTMKGLLEIIERLTRPETDRIERELAGGYAGKHEAGA